MSAKKPPEKPAALRFGHRFCICEAEAAEIDHDVRARMAAIFSAKYGVFSRSKTAFSSCSHAGSSV